MTSTRKKHLKAKLRKPLLIGLVAAGIAMMVPDVQDYLSDFTARQWTPIPATITSVESPILVQLRDPYFDPQIRYEYYFDSKKYIGNRISFTKVGPFLGYDNGLYQQAHAVGQLANARVDPDRPENAVIEPDPNESLVFSHLIAVAILCSLIYLSIYPRANCETPI